MTISKDTSAFFGTILLLIALVSMSGTSIANAQSTRTVKFTNSEGFIATDLHISFHQKTKIDTGPADRHPNGNRVEFYFLNVPDKSDVSISMSSNSDILKISNWYWTQGGTASAFGTIPGKTHSGDNTSNFLSFLDKPATGDGIVQIVMGGQTYDFTTTSGFSAEESALAFFDFARGLFDGIQLINPYLMSERSVRLYGNLLGDPATELRVSILQQDTSQTISGIPEPGSWLMFIAGFCIAGIWLRSKRPGPGYGDIAKLV